jgi:hypothetical protein
MKRQILATWPSATRISAKFIPRRSEQYGEATFLMVATGGAVKYSKMRVRNNPSDRRIRQMRRIGFLARSGRPLDTAPLSKTVHHAAGEGGFEQSAVAAPLLWRGTRRRLHLSGARRAETQAKARGGPSRIRTCNPRSRNPLLYPVELWDRWRLCSTGNMKNPLRSQAGSEPKSLKLRQSRMADLWVGSALYATPPGRRRGKGTCSGNAARHFFGRHFSRHQSVTFSRPFIHHAALDRAQGAPS